MEITGRTNIIGLIGNPIEHSISPQLHNRLAEYLGLNLVYVPFRVAAEDLERLIHGFKAFGIIGFNVTIPHKIDIIKFLDNLEEDAVSIGSVNTVKNINGKFFGYNTDGVGFINSLRDKKFVIKDSKAVVLGAGGAARAVAVKLIQEGIKQIVILNRSNERASELVSFLNKNNANISFYDELTKECLEKYCRDCQIIINTTPAGMWPKTEELPLSDIIGEKVFMNKPLVYDLIYNPIKTKFLNLAEENSCKTCSGLPMLIYQGIKAFEIWNDTKVPDEYVKSEIKRFQEIFEKD